MPAQAELRWKIAIPQFDDELPSTLHLSSSHVWFDREYRWKPGIVPTVLDRRVGIIALADPPFIEESSNGPGIVVNGLAADGSIWSRTYSNGARFERATDLGMPTWRAIANDGYVEYIHGDGRQLVRLAATGVPTRIITNPREDQSIDV